MMQAEIRTWLQHYVCCTKPYKSNLKWGNSKRKNSKTNRREGSRVTFSKKVNKVEPLYIDNNGVLKQRSYISLLSSASEDSIGEELRFFVEKYVNQTVHDAATKYYRELERELRIKNRAETKYNELRKFSVIREETETSIANESESESRLSSAHDDLRNDNCDAKPPFNMDIYDEFDGSFSKEETLSKSNLLQNSDEDSLRKRTTSESESDSDYDKFNSDSEQSTDSDKFDKEVNNSKQISYSKTKKLKKTKRTNLKTKPKRKEHLAVLSNEKNKKINKVEPYKQRTGSSEKGYDFPKGKMAKKRNFVKKPTKLSIKK